MSDQPQQTSALGDLPAWARIAFLLGVPSVIAVFLVWFLATDVKAATNATKDQSATNTLMIQQLRTDMRDAILQRSAENARILKTLQQLCVNQADSQEKAERCLQ